MEVMDYCFPVAVSSTFCWQNEENNLDTVNSELWFWRPGSQAGREMENPGNGCTVWG